jgi:heat shock protein HtpX
MRNQLRTLLFLGILSAALIGFGGLLGTGPMILCTVLALALNVGAYFFSDRIVLRMHRAQEVSAQAMPGLHRMVEELATRAGIPKPRLYFVDDPAPNAFATGRSPRHGVIAVTAGILRALPERELRAVIAHEIGHIKNRDILVTTVAAVIASAITWIANALQWSAILGGGGSSSEEEGGGSPIAALALAFLAPIAAMLLQMAVSRSREYLADETGAHLSADPEGLARALEGIERAAHGHAPLAAEGAPALASLHIHSAFAGAAGLARLFSTHPPTAERTRRLRAMLGLGSRSAA